MYNEAQIIAGLLNNEETAVERIVELYGDRLLRTALGITGDIQIAEEVVQDTFLQVCRRINSFRQQSTLQTWMYRITVNLAKNRLRSRWFKKACSMEEEKINQLISSADSNPEASVLQQEARREVTGCLQRLPEKYREALVLRYLEDLSIKEISEILKQPAGTIKSKISRGKTLLKKEMVKKEVVSLDGP